MSGATADDLVVPLSTRDRQRRAADPGASAWVSANAGAGKTKVLTDRVIRLLLGGTLPSRILCLTFTKAAAAEMTIRVFKRLGDWVTLEDGRLSDELTELTGAKPTRAELATARRLFARAVETPGGLKIETIHAFCERVLHSVPFEANVPARFAVLDDTQTADIMAAARADVLAAASLGGPGRDGLAASLEIAAAAASGQTLTELIDCAVADEDLPADQDERAQALARMRELFGLADGDEPDAVRRRMVEEGLPPSEWPAVAAELRRTGKSSDADQAASFDAASAARSLATRLEPYLSVFFTDKGDLRKVLATKGVDSGLCARLKTEQERLASLRETLKAAETVERTDALYRLAGAVRTRAEATKARLGALDFADLIKRTLAVLERDSAAWVLYKLDRGIDHVLVDEAQDTNPDQWKILRLLTEDFTAGAGRPLRSVRTLFAVGDPKQSIFSFQGADPRWFESGRRYWRSRSEAAGLLFEDVRLDLSFRSAPAVLRAVDHTFRIGAHYKGLSFEDTVVGTTHESARPRAPGHVEIWPTEVKREDDSEPDAWSVPVDLPPAHAPHVVLAGRIADAARHWTAPGNGTGRVWRPKDILILVRRRGPVFFAIIRALKAKGVPVAGADRFEIGEHIAVKDLVAAGAAALRPENDLVLAAALKSPLVGLTDDDLIAIAADRAEGESLAAALARTAEEGNAPARTGCAALARWREGARRHGPFGFYAGLLGPEGGRRLLIERLGGEAADAIDAFLTQAQLAESGPETPSLTTFLARFEASAHTIKRDLDSSGDEVRVMTVHGAKGLEAPIVILADGCEVHGPERALVGLDLGDGTRLPVWSPGKTSDCEAVAKARAAWRERALEEHNRLLYVAMTRAKDRLVVAPYASGRGGEPAEAWCAMVRRGFAEAGEEPVLVEHTYGPASVWADGTDPAVADGRGPVPADLARAVSFLPDWLTRPVDPEPEPAPPLRPSGALAGADRDWRPARRDGSSPDEARRRGTLIHALLEHLPAVSVSRRAVAAKMFVAARAPRLEPDDAEAIAAEALAVLDHPALQPLFGPGSRGEVPVSGTVASPRWGERAVSGQIDRLVIGHDEVVLADFKTGRPPPGGAVPDAYRDQLALYAALLRAIFPGRRVRALLVWTAGPDAVELTPGDIAAALGTAA